jgi:uncharacterized protein
MTEEPLSLLHKKILYGPLRSLALPVSEYSFANLYLFRAEHAYSVLFGEEIFIRGTARNGDPYVMPTQDVRAMKKDLLDRMMSDYGMLYPVPEQWLDAFNPNAYSVTFDDAESDYIHDIAKLAGYRGNKLHASKNLLNQFLARYNAQALPLTNDRLPDALAVLDAWQKESGEEPEKTDYAPCREALALYEELVLCGAMYYADGVPAGSIVGEELDPASFVLHFAKARREFKGIYQYMYNQFAKIMPSKYAVFNFEQDLGMETLRRAKASYHPERMIKKYRVRLRST